MKPMRHTIRCHRMITATPDRIMSYLLRSTVTPILPNHISQHHRRGTLCRIILLRNNNSISTTMTKLPFFSLVTLMAQILKANQTTPIITKDQLRNQLRNQPLSQ